MKKTIVMEFPDEFVFPEKFSYSKCCDCPLLAEYDGVWHVCFVTDRGDTPCPFYGGADTVTAAERQ